MKFLFFVFVLFYFINQSLSQSWQYLFSDGSSEFYIQEDAGRHPLYGRRLWVKEVVPKIEYLKNGRKQILYNVFVVRLMVFDCTDREYNLEKVVYYNSKGAVVLSESFSSNGIIVTTWNPAIPGRVGEKFVLYMCGSGEREKYIQKFY